MKIILSKIETALKMATRRELSSEKVEMAKEGAKITRKYGVFNLKEEREYSFVNGSPTMTIRYSIFDKTDGHGSYCEDKTIIYTYNPKGRLVNKLIL